MSYISGLSGNEIYCLSKLNYQLGNISIGNSIRNLGLRETISSDEKGMIGLELDNLTHLIREGRQLAFQRMLDESSLKANMGIIGITSNLMFHPHSVEFIATGNQIQQQCLAAEIPFFSTPAKGQDLFTLIDTHYRPISFVFGNIAYSTGMTGGLIGKLKNIARGEVVKLSHRFNQMRHTALERLITQGKKTLANSIIGIQTITTPFSGVNEMVMIGTAATHPLFTSDHEFVTSHLTPQETWNLAKLGYAPRQLIVKSCVFSLGLVTSMASVFKSFLKEDIELTQLIHHAKKRIYLSLQSEADSIGADSIIGVKTHVYFLGNGLIELLTLGTAIKRHSEITTLSDQLLPQAMTA